MTFQKTPILNVIEVLHDGERRYASMCEHLKAASLRRYFAEESARRARFADELQMVLRSAIGKPVDQVDTSSVALDHFSGEISNRQGVSDEILLARAEESENTAKQAFTDALQVDGLPPLIRAILVERRSHIRQSHKQVKNFRENLAA